MRLHQSQLQQPQVAEAVTATSTLVSDPSTLVEAPSKLVALAIDRLGHTARLIADIRLVADRPLCRRPASPKHQTSAVVPQRRCLHASTLPRPSIRWKAT